MMICFDSHDFVLNSPFEDGILDGWVGAHGKQGSRGTRAGLAFIEGGVDCASMMLAAETALIYNERIGLTGRFWTTQCIEVSLTNFKARTACDEGPRVAITKVFD